MTYTYSNAKGHNTKPGQCLNHISIGRVPNTVTESGFMLNIGAALIKYRIINPFRTIRIGIHSKYLSERKPTNVKGIIWVMLNLVATQAFSIN